MRSLNFLLIILSVMILITSIFGCISKGSKETNYIRRTEKIIDPEYLIQHEILDFCKKNLSISQKAVQSAYQTFIVSSAYTEILQKLSSNDITIFDKRGFIGCFLGVAEHKALKALCPDFRRSYYDFDIFEKIALLEYEKCVADKNEPYLRSINFLIPKILQEDIEKISETILNKKK